MADALIALGANLGDREATLRRAVELLAETPATRLRAVSGWHATEPVGGPAGQPAFLNGAAWLTTEAEPDALHGRLLDVERALGRRRDERWGPRVVDLDLLLYDERVVNSAALVVPHPRMSFRRFVVEPAAEIAAAWRVPGTRMTLGELRTWLRTRPPHVAIVAADPDHARAVAAAVVPAAPPRCGAPGCVYAADPAPPASLVDPAPLVDPAAAAERTAQRIAALEASLSAAAGAPVVADFWLDDVLLEPLARVEGPHRGVPVAPLEPLVDARAERLAPKLLVVLDSAPSPGDAAPEPRARALDALVAARRRGPLLRVPSGDLARAAEEVAAALVAMGH